MTQTCASVNANDIDENKMIYKANIGKTVDQTRNLPTVILEEIVSKS